MSVLTSSGEDYLKIIYVIYKRNGTVHSSDIVKETGYTRPSISAAMKALLNKGYIIMSKDKEIFLTKSGEDIAKLIYERHVLFAKWFKHLGIDEETAEKDACNIEHCLSDESFKAIKGEILKQVGE